MTIYDLLILQIIAHLLADFTFQSEVWVRHKRRYGFRARFLYWHALIVFAISFLFANQLTFVFASSIIALSHILIDGFKNNLSKHFKRNGYIFFIDQTLHLTIIVGAVLLIKHYFSIIPLFKIPITTHQLLIIAGFVLCTKPANVIIREVFILYKIKLPKDSKPSLLNAGKLIGISERMLILTLLLYGEFEVVGFLIAAKSILRYEGADPSKTEYVLIGTLLSFGIAILTYVVINQVAM